MHLKLTGHHLKITPALRAYVEKKLERVVRHFDQLIDVHCVLTVEKLVHKAEATLHMRGETSTPMSTDEQHVRGHRRAGRQARPPAWSSTRKRPRDHHAAEARNSARS